MSNTPLIANLNELESLIDEQQVRETALGLWKSLAILLAHEHKEDASRLFEEFCNDLQAGSKKFKEMGHEALFMDAISQFKAEASWMGLR